MAKKFILHKNTAPAGSAPAAASAPIEAGEPALPRIVDLAEFLAALPAGETLTCPICRATCATDDVLFIAQHANLPHDLVLGPGQAYRFRPTRFTPDGAALDPLGVITTETACPACHAAWNTPGDAPATPLPRTPATPRDKNAPERLPPALATMDGIRKLVAEVVALVNRTGSARILGEVNARQYAELCRRANARLALCQQFIQNHQPGAALDQAEQPPPLMELSATLPFADLSQWGQLCARNRWTVAEPVDSTAVAEVQAGIAEARKLEPALRALRAAVRRNLPYEALCVLRTLLQLEPDTPFWGEDVAAFERTRQRELLASATSAIEEEDLAALTAPAIELAGPWLDPPAAELRQRVQTAFDRLRRTDATQRGLTLTAQFVAACAAQDFDTAHATHSALTAVCAEGFYQTDADARQYMAQAQVWFKDVAAQRAADAAFGRDLAALTDAVAKPAAMAEVERLYQEIRGTGRAGPAELMAQADLLIQRHHARCRQRQRLLLSAKVAGAAAALLLLGSAGWTLARRHYRTAACARLTQCLKSEDLAAFDQEHASLTHGLGRVLGLAPTTYPPLAGLSARRDELASRLQDRTSALGTALAALQQDQARHFTLSASAFLPLLARAKQAARTINDLAAIEAVETPWRADQNARLTQALATLPTLAPPDSNIFATLPFPAATQQVAHYVTQVEAVAGLLGADKQELAKIAPYLTIASACRSNQAIRVSTLQGAATATTLNSYLDTLVRYTDRFTNDTLSVHLAEILASRKEYRTALHVAAELQLQSAVLATNSAWAQARQGILGLRENKALNNLRWICRKDTSELLFLLEREKPEPNFHGTWAECYQPLSGDTAPLFQRARVTDTPVFNQGISDQPSRLWHHTEIINDMLARAVNINATAEGERFLEEKFRQIGAAPIWNNSRAPGTNDLPNIAFQIQFLSFLAEQLVRVSPWPEWQVIFAELRSADMPEANWICLNSGDIKRINQAGTLALPRIFGPGGQLARLQVRRAAADVLARTPLAWAGYATLDQPPRFCWQTATPPADFIVLRLDATRTRMIAVAAGTPAQPCLPLIPGEPLLAWSDGDATAPKNAAIRQTTGLAEAATLLPPWYPAPPAP